MASGRCTIRMTRSLRGTARLQWHLFGQPGTSIPGTKPRGRARLSAVHGRQCTERSECVSEFPPGADRRGIAAPGKATKGQGAGAVEYAAGQGAALGRVPIVQWYPGHIAKAERQLKQQLKLVDVVLEVRDARIPVATWHPGVKGWIGSKPRLLILNRADMISREDMSEWEAYFASMGETFYWTVGNRGDGTQRLVRAMMKVSKVVNEKRRNRGLNPRAVRACVIGFPNIGKSALINRLVKRRVVDSAPRPGVTRVLRWVRMGGNIDMLDSPGVIPMSFHNQVAAQRLAMCNDIGEASYVSSLIAAQLIMQLRTLPASAAILERIGQRYGVDPLQGTGEDVVAAVAAKMFQGESERAGIRILKDFRELQFGNIALELPSMVELSPG
ncbi:unnamed protein product [Ostreobium quekettii]|uniref:G domain-containing protein n=1 Tax=Ostreobium quekettii TaxID=121088 RepID=A0A8S1J0C7_9CHLO|nr:unnamed protein product [Ostreobium quekettii]|eukprot:evm.model.scf_2961.2 EVM.evm.TU.scf_2961.2   scf_2961:12024-13181(+)